MENKKKPHVKIGTIGHVDHGKTSLTKAIHETLNSTPVNIYPPVDIDNKFHGITINTQTKQKTALSQQIIDDYERKKREEETRWLEETGYYDSLLEKFKKHPPIIETIDENEK